MAGETLRLAAYAAGLAARDVPPDVLRRAKDLLIDTVAACFYGRDLPWSRIVTEGVRAAGPDAGPCRVLDMRGGGVPAEAAARANGVLAHAAELDSLRQPGAGVHPGAVLVPAALAAAQERGKGGEALLLAIVAGTEILLRIGRATRHSAETRGFHAPGLTGPFGAAVAAGRIFGLDADRMANAFGIAGSLCGGLLEFARSHDGGMVKRLHLGRAAENGVTAARLAAAGFTGPRTVLEGAYGFLHAYCAETDLPSLASGLGEEWESRRVCFKRYPCHITAHAPVEAVRALRVEAGFTPAAVAAVTVQASRKAAELHDIRDPQDLVMAQYSIPFCVAVALARDVSDPDSFGETSLRDPQVRALCRRVRVVPGGAGWAATTRIELADGRVLERHVEDFPGAPSRPLDPAALGEKFRALTRRLGEAEAAALLARLERIETEETLDWLGAGMAGPTSGGRA